MPKRLNKEDRCQYCKHWRNQHQPKELGFCNVERCRCPHYVEWTDVSRKDFSPEVGKKQGEKQDVGDPVKKKETSEQ